MSPRLLSIVMPLAAAGCVTVRPVASPTTFIPAKQPELVWVTVHSGERLALSGPTVQADSIVGRQRGERVAVPLPHVRLVHARQSDRRRTLLLVAGVGVAAGFVVWRAASTGGPQSTCVFDPRSGWNCP